MLTNEKLITMVAISDATIFSRTDTHVPFTVTRLPNKATFTTVDGEYVFGKNTLASIVDVQVYIPWLPGLKSIDDAGVFNMIEIDIIDAGLSNQVFGVKRLTVPRFDKVYSVGENILPTSAPFYDKDYELSLRVPNDFYYMNINLLPEYDAIPVNLAVEITVKTVVGV